jgi:hypothetical protein
MPMAVARQVAVVEDVETASPQTWFVAPHSVRESGRMIEEVITC